MMPDDGRKMNATLSTDGGKAEVVLSRRDTGERVGVHVFATLDKALAWLEAMKWDYKVAT